MAQVSRRLSDFFRRRSSLTSKNQNVYNVEEDFAKQQDGGALSPSKEPFLSSLHPIRNSNQQSSSMISSYSHVPRRGSREKRPSKTLSENLLPPNKAARTQQYAVPGDLRNIFTPAEIHQFRTEFAVFDVNGDGECDAEELAVIMDKLGEKCTPDDLKDLISEVDKNNDGRINLEEFKEMVKMYAHENKKLEQEYDTETDVGSQRYFREQSKSEISHTL